MPFWKLFYHIVWSTKVRLPFLTPENEPVIFEHIRHKARTLKAHVFALNGWVDHVHLAVSIPPRLSVAQFVGQVKGVSATLFNKSHPEAPVVWQDQYGVFSTDEKRLPFIVTYIERQKQHHAGQSLIPILERVEGEPLRLFESSSAYLSDEPAWWEEMLSL